MAKFTFRLDCDNAAFYAPETGETDEYGDPVEGEFDPAHEVARLLREAADRIERDGSVHHDALMDENGNRVGDYYMTA